MTEAEIINSNVFYACDTVADLNYDCNKPNQCSYVVFDPTGEHAKEGWNEKHIHQMMGLLPEFIASALWADDPDKEMILQYGFPVSPFEGFEWDEQDIMLYPGNDDEPDDPPLYPHAVFGKDNTRIIVYPFAWVAIIPDINQPDQRNIYRMD